MKFNTRNERRNFCCTIAKIANMTKCELTQFMQIISKQIESTLHCNKFIGEAHFSHFTRIMSSFHLNYSSFVTLFDFDWRNREKWKKKYYSNRERGRGKSETLNSTVSLSFKIKELKRKIYKYNSSYNLSPKLRKRVRRESERNKHEKEIHKSNSRE